MLKLAGLQLELASTSVAQSLVPSSQEFHQPVQKIKIIIKLTLHTHHVLLDEKTKVYMNKITRGS